MTQAQPLRGSPAAAIPLPRINSRHWVARMKAALRATFLAPVQQTRKNAGHRAVQREAFMEDAAMAREMYRL
ncbi:hypothetical protein [Mycobacterium sp. Root265]|uniref:hypothetical protein n=1 Tax=Mycobacterium sp. Root265 TaxID=1736504 RepID=UPI0012E354CE|nr:hypothetical protein [Mycobacterium sp. Root265]